MALIDKASLLMVPSTYEAGTLYNVLPSGNRAPDSTDQNSGYDQTRADFTFDRGSNAAATRIGSDGLIKKYRENLLLQSNQFDTTWANSNTTETSGQSGYDGTNDAWLLSKSAASGYLIQSISSTGVQTFSVYAKAGTLNWIRLNVNFTSGTDPIVYFDLANGVVGTSTGEIDTNITSVGNGWHRCSVTANGTISDVRFFPADGDTDTSGTTGSIYIQNAQLESGMVSTDYLDSGATTGKAGVLIDLPRINYDANGENGSLLLEPQRVNSVPYSEGGFAYQTSTSGTGVTPVITENAATSPEGVQNAFRVDLNRGAGNTSGDWSWIYQSGVAYTGSNVITVYLKAATSGDVGKEIAIRGAGGSDAVVLTADWKRHQIIKTATATSDLGLYSRGGENVDNEVSCFVYGFQVEASATYPTSYIPNMGESGGVTRAADSCSVTGVSDVIGQTEGTLFVDYETDNAQDNGRLIAIGDGSTSNRILLRNQGSGTLLYVAAGGSSTWSTTYYTPGNTGRIKIALAYANNDGILFVNGSSVNSDTSVTVPACSNVYIGTSEYGGSESVNMLVHDVTLFKERLSDSELATLTTL